MHFPPTNGDTMQDAERNHDLDALVGSWATEATHPELPSIVVLGEVVFEWLEGERFLIQRARNDHPQFPDSIAIIGGPADGPLMYYFDSRGVQRVYEMSFDGGAWRLSREAPGFSQRFEGTFADGGASITGLWKVSRDGSSWDDDLAITFRPS